MADYSWKPAFEAVANWLGNYEDRQTELIAILKKVGIGKGLMDKDIDGGPMELRVMDPFTFFALFMKHKNYEKRSQLFASLLTTQSIDVIAPKDFSGVPSCQPQKVWLFGNTADRKESDIPNLWKLFKAIGSDAVTDDLFSLVLDIHNVGFAKITQCAFYAYPDTFLPIDSQTKPWLEAKGIRLPDETWSDYRRCLADIRKITEKPFHELSHEAWLANQTPGNGKLAEVNDASTHYQVNSKITKPMATHPLNQILYGPPGTGKTYATTEKAVQIADHEWYVAWQSEGGEGSRERLKAKYDELVSQGQISFVTFHQSFSYEDFIEGIRAKTENGAIHYSVEDGVFKNAVAAARAGEGANNLSKAIDVSGRRVWKMSLGNTQLSEDHIYQDCIEKGYVALGYGWDVDFTGCDTRQKVREAYLSQMSQSFSNNDYPVTSVNTFVNVIKPGDLVVISDGNSKFRAIGEITSDYCFEEGADSGFYHQTRKTTWHRTFEESVPRELMLSRALSQMTLYELRDTTLKRDRLQKYLSVQSEGDKQEQNHVLIIDEINRGNISRIFGEIITLIEQDKRSGQTDARTVKLPYSKLDFSVPPNLYLLGTMNTADKSLAQMDLALRRRFEFEELLPAPALLKTVVVFDTRIEDMLRSMNSRIEVLLDREHQIGHSYFWSLLTLQNEIEKQQTLANIFRKKSFHYYKNIFTLIGSESRGF